MIDVGELKGLENMEYLASAPRGETIVSMVKMGESVIVATDKNLYELKMLPVPRLEAII